MRVFSLAGAMAGLLAVALGALGSHLLAPGLSTGGAALFDTALRYQMWHGLALFALPGLLPVASERWLRAGGWAFITGIVFFSGSLYFHALTGNRPPLPLAPAGGLSLLAGWGLVIRALLAR